MDNIMKINYKNEVFDLSGENVETVLNALEIDTTKVDLEKRGDTLFILSKTGTKGAEDYEYTEESENTEEISTRDPILDKLYKNLGTGVEKSKKCRLNSQGKLVYISDILTDEAVDRLAEFGINVTEDTTDEEYKEYVLLLEKDEVKTLAELIGKTPEETIEIVKELRKLL